MIVSGSSFLRFFVFELKRGREGGWRDKESLFRSMVDDDMLLLAKVPVHIDQFTVKADIFICMYTIFYDCIVVLFVLAP